MVRSDASGKKSEKKTFIPPLFNTPSVQTNQQISADFSYLNNTGKYPAYETVEKDPSETDAVKNGTTKNGSAENGTAENGAQTSLPPIGRDQIREAYSILQKYRAGKANLERRIIENEQWYKLRHWDCMRGSEQQVKPTSAWLFNCIQTKHANAMDNIPSPSILPREEGDRWEAEKLSSILPVILDQNDFEQIYSDAWDHKCRSGTAVYGVFWDGSKHGGLGDIALRDIDILSLYWEPGVRDIQSSRNLFSVELVDTDLLEAKYPFLAGKLTGANQESAQYICDDSIDTSGKSAVIDWYYKKREGNHTVLHYCKFVGDELLYATENDPTLRTRGLYDHGMYPFIFDVLFPTPGTPAGFGYIDIGKNCQAYIDRGNQAIMKNMLACAVPRILVSEDSPINESEYCDLSADIVHCSGAITDATYRPISAGHLDSVYISALQNKIDELKETTGNRDVSNGGSSGGVTAASAIAAMQEAGSRLDRDSCKASYRAFRKLCLMTIELIRQFYDTARCFRITGEDGIQKFISYSSENIAPQKQQSAFGVELGYRTPLFDIEITAAKESPYSRVAQNEMALQFYQAEFFNPQNADAALACLDMMDFDRKQPIMRKIRERGEQYRRAAMLAEAYSLSADVANQSTASNQNAETNQSAKTNQNAAANRNAASEKKIGENSNMKNSRIRSANSIVP